MSTSLHTGDLSDTQADKPAEAAQQPKVNMLAPFKVLNFNLLFSGQAISIIGDCLYMIALPWLILNNGGSAQDLGIVLAAYGIPRAASMLLGGWLSDKLRPRRLMLISDIARTILMALMAFLALNGQPVLWQMIAIAIPLGAFAGMFTPASMAIIPDILKDEDLQAGNALNYAVSQVAVLLGSVISGVVVANLTAGGALAIDAITFVVSALTLALMGSVRYAQEGKEEAAPVEAAEGEQVSFWSFIRSSGLIRTVIIISTAASLAVFGLVEVAIPALIHGPLHGDANGFGFVIAAWGAGAFFGGLASGALGNLKNRKLFVLLATLVMSGALAALPYIGIWGAVVAMLVAGVASSMMSMVLITGAQKMVPRHLLGRVMGVMMFGSFGSYPLSVAILGVLVTWFGPVILFPACAAFLTLVSLLALLEKEL